MRAPLFYICTASAIFGITSFQIPTTWKRLPTTTRLSSFAVSVDEIEKDLTPSERSVTAVVRKCGPSVAYVTSVRPVLPMQRRRRRRSAKKEDKRNDLSLPQGQALGSGSGFITTSGYVCTNYHVIEQAYTGQQAGKQVSQIADFIIGNLTSSGSPLPFDLVNRTVSKALKAGTGEASMPKVYVRVNSEKDYLPCRVVDVEPDLDLAVLKIEESPDSATVWDTVAFGSSSSLLVGQSVVAIGNPFGLDKTVTTGVVSAVNRELRGGTVRTPATVPIKNCIQTDAAINPGNSGGPLLNLNGDVVGINTAIITTSGSSAGIGFAVPSDQLRPVVDRIIREDQIKFGKRPNRGWLGVSIVNSLQNVGNTTSKLCEKNWISAVAKNSPASEAGISGTRLAKEGTVVWGDAIVSVGGNSVDTFDDLQSELDKCVVGEKVALTLENADGERRVVYVTLQKNPKT